MAVGMLYAGVDAQHAAVEDDDDDTDLTPCDEEVHRLHTNVLFGSSSSTSSRASVTACKGNYCSRSQTGHQQELIASGLPRMSLAAIASRRLDMQNDFLLKASMQKSPRATSRFRNDDPRFAPTPLRTGRNRFVHPRASASPSKSVAAAIVKQKPSVLPLPVGASRCSKAVTSTRRTAQRCMQQPYANPSVRGKNLARWHDNRRSITGAICLQVTFDDCTSAARELKVLQDIGSRVFVGDVDTAGQAYKFGVRRGDELISVQTGSSAPLPPMDGAQTLQNLANSEAAKSAATCSSTRIPLRLFFMGFAGKFPAEVQVTAMYPANCGFHKIGEIVDQKTVFHIRDTVKFRSGQEGPLLLASCRENVCSTCSSNICEGCTESDYAKPVSVFELEAEEARLIFAKAKSHISRSDAASKAGTLLGHGLTTPHSTATHSGCSGSLTLFGSGGSRLLRSPSSSASRRRARSMPAASSSGDGSPPGTPSPISDAPKSFLHIQGPLRGSRSWGPSQSLWHADV